MIRYIPIYTVYKYRIFHPSDHACKRMPRMSRLVPSNPAPRGGRGEYPSKGNPTRSIAGILSKVVFMKRRSGISLKKCHLITTPPWRNSSRTRIAFALIRELMKTTRRYSMVVKKACTCLFTYFHHPQGKGFRHSQHL